MADDSRIEKKLDAITELLKYLIAIDLARGGVPQSEIAKRVKMATATINKMVKGVQGPR
jgi:hypothetical protein